MLQIKTKHFRLVYQFFNNCTLFFLWWRIKAIEMQIQLANTKNEIILIPELFFL